MNYKDSRNILSENGTTKLSPHLKFGTVSIREVYWTSQGNLSLISELYWRDFYAYLVHFNP